MISVSQTYPSPWISPDDITRPFNLIVKLVTVEDFRLPDGTKERKIVLAFTRTAKRLPLNKTQAKTLARLLGDDAEQWTGSTIVLAPALAPNRKPTIAVGVPQADQQVEPPPTAAACETCGQTTGHADGCPDA